MAFIAFLGCDGSGKSAVIELVATEMAARGVRVERGHWRPAPMGPANSVGQPADDPHGKPLRGTITSILKLGWLAASWWAGWLRGLAHQARTGLVLFDRYHADLLVDPIRYRYGGPMGLARLATKWMPQPDLAFFLDAPPEVLLARKQEVSAEALAASRRNYLTLAASNRKLVVIDAARPLTEVVGEVLARIEHLQGQRALS